MPRMGTARLCAKGALGEYGGATRERICANISSLVIFTQLPRCGLGPVTTVKSTRVAVIKGKILEWNSQYSSNTDTPPFTSTGMVPKGSNRLLSGSSFGAGGWKSMHLGHRCCPGRQRKIWHSGHSSCLTTRRLLESTNGKYSVPGKATGGLGVEVIGVVDRSGVPVVVGLVFSGLFLCFAACLLVDHGRSLRALCITKERAFRRPCLELFAFAVSTKRNSCWTEATGGDARCAVAGSRWLAMKSTPRRPGGPGRCCPAVPSFQDGSRWRCLEAQNRHFVASRGCAKTS